MKNASRVMAVVLSCALMATASWGLPQDWPQWLGPHRDAKASGFNAPETWPQELTQTWRVVVGEGVATPALVGDKLYVFARQEGNEVTLCLDAATGKQQWRDRYESQGASGPAASFSGPRCSPAVAGGKVVTLGVRGVLSCLDAATGKVLWRQDDFQGAWPRFFTSSSPLIANGLCVAQLGGSENGGIIAYDLATGAEEWKWMGDAPAYASPAVMTVGGTELVMAQTETKMLALALADGKLVWETPYAVQGRGYNAATPVVEGQTLIYAGSGRGTTAVRFEPSDDGFATKELWKNPDNSVQFNTPTLKGGFLYGISAANQLFCINAADGKTAWTAPVTVAADAGEEGGGGRRRRGGGGGYGSIVDAGSVLLALTPSSELIVFEPNDKAYVEVARIKVADTPTHAYPVASGNRLVIKDQESVILYTVL